MTALVGIDVGTSGVKAIALSPDGEILARAERDYPLSTPRPGWAEQDPDDWARAADAALADLGVEPAAIGWSGQMHGLVVLDEAGEVIRPAILWNDQRTAAECAEIEERIGLERLIQLTGNRALTGFTAPKLLWLRTHEPEAFARIAHVLLPKDYVRLPAHGRARDRRRRRVRHAPLRRRQPALERRGARRARAAARVAAARVRVDRRSRAPATRPRVRSASASTHRARCRSSSAPRASSSQRSTSTGRSPRRGCTPSATPSPVPGTRWA